jgi:reticulon-4 receptor-like 2
MPSRWTVVLVTLLLSISALTFWLWFVIDPENVAPLCPMECTCYPGDNKVSCNGTSLTSVPIIRFPDVTVLSLSRNNISIIERGCFVSRGLTGLKKLVIWECGLRTIELGAFSGLTNLALLDMSFNEISEIIPGTFVDMNSLEYLILYSNRIKLLHNDEFRGLLKLKFIDITGNELQYLHPDSFLGLPNFQDLNLKINFGLQIPTLSNFINSSSLLHLDISHCNVISLSVETFANVSALEELGLRNNNLRTLDIDILRALPKLSTLYLQDNPLQCDCQLKEVWRWCEDHNIRTVYGKLVPQCETPGEMKGMGWEMLHNVQCLQDNITYSG